MVFTQPEHGTYDHQKPRNSTWLQPADVSLPVMQAKLPHGSLLIARLIEKNMDTPSACGKEFVSELGCRNDACRTVASRQANRELFYIAIPIPKVIQCYHLFLHLPIVHELIS
jgi:hypothetical protein